MNPDVIAMEDSGKGCLTDVFNMVRGYRIKLNYPTATIITQLDQNKKIKYARFLFNDCIQFLVEDSIESDSSSLASMICHIMEALTEIGLTGEQASHIFDLVQEANMAKLFPDGTPHYNADNKVIKPEGWVAPDEKIKEYVESIIASQNA